MALRIVGYCAALAAGLGLFLLGYRGYGVGLFLLVGSTALNVETVAHSALSNSVSDALSRAVNDGSQLRVQDIGSGISQVVQEAGRAGSNAVTNALIDATHAVQADAKSGPVHTASIRRSWAPSA